MCEESQGELTKCPECSGCGYSVLTSNPVLDEVCLACDGAGSVRARIQGLPFETTMVSESSHLFDVGSLKCLFCGDGGTGPCLKNVREPPKSKEEQSLELFLQLVTATGRMYVSPDIAESLGNVQVVQYLVPGVAIQVVVVPEFEPGTVAACKPPKLGLPTTHDLTKHSHF